MKSQLDILDGAQKILGELIRTHPSLASKLYPITFRLSRSRKQAGTARVRSNLVSLSYPIFASEENYASKFYNTVTHEIAHILVPPVRGDQHGWSWRMMHKRLGGDGERCHSMQPAEAFQAVTYDVPCPKCGQAIKLSRIRYKRQLTGPKYRHVKCPPEWFE